MSPDEESRDERHHSHRREEWAPGRRRGSAFSMSATRLMRTWIRGGLLERSPTPAGIARDTFLLRSLIASPPATEARARARGAIE